MNTQTLKTPWHPHPSSGWARGLSIATLAAGAWALSSLGSPARAHGDVHWSIGVNTPGVVVGVSNAPRVVYGPPRVVYAPPPVVYGPPPVYYAPRPIYYAPPPVYYAPPRPVYRSGWAPAPRWHGPPPRHHRRR